MDWNVSIVLLWVVFAPQALFYLILRSWKIRDAELQSHLGQETRSANAVVYRVSAAFRCSWRGWCWSYGCCSTGTGGWRCSAGLVCHTHTFCDKRQDGEICNQQIKQARNPPARAQNHIQSRTSWTQVISWHVRLQPHIRESDSCSTNFKRGGAHTAIGGVDRRPNPNWRWHHSDHI